ncbi:MAG TPA: GreA/GreB family elongation factor [Bacillota bacterium]|nr:GreA/GreB family elongation factor [Bacillota bacterium]
MNQPIQLTKDAFNSLVANLLEIEEGFNTIFEEFFPEPSQEAEETKQNLKSYLQHMDETLRYITIDETAKNEFPFVIINSEVKVEEAGCLGIYRYKLVSPLKEKVYANEISFLSPMGKALLLKEVNDNLVVEAPGGNYHYKVLSVWLGGGPKSFKFNSPVMRAGNNKLA